MPCPYRLTGLPHLTERASEIKTARSLVIPSDVAMGDRPLLNLRGFGHRFAHRWTREAVSSFVSPDPDQVAVKFNEHVFRREAGQTRRPPSGRWDSRGRKPGGRH